MIFFRRFFFKSSSKNWGDSISEVPRPMRCPRKKLWASKVGKIHDFDKNPPAAMHQHFGAKMSQSLKCSNFSRNRYFSTAIRLNHVYCAWKCDFQAFLGCPNNVEVRWRKSKNENNEKWWFLSKIRKIKIFDQKIIKISKKMIFWKSRNFSKNQYFSTGFCLNHIYCFWKYDFRAFSGYSNNLKVVCSESKKSKITKNSDF